MCQDCPYTVQVLATVSVWLFLGLLGVLDDLDILDSAIVEFYGASIGIYRVKFPGKEQYYLWKHSIKLGFINSIV